jgi:hypothetical protein
VKCTLFASGNVRGFVCGQREKRLPAKFCVACLASGVKRAARLLCDWPLETGSYTEPPKTCSKPMCDEHRHGPTGVDYCRDHEGPP